MPNPSAEKSFFPLSLPENSAVDAATTIAIPTMMEIIMTAVPRCPDFFRRDSAESLLSNRNEFPEERLNLFRPERKTSSLPAGRA